MAVTYEDIRRRESLELRLMNVQETVGHAVTRLIVKPLTVRLLRSEGAFFYTATSLLELDKSPLQHACTRKTSPVEIAARARIESPQTAE